MNYWTRTIKQLKKIISLKIIISILESQHLMVGGTVCVKYGVGK